MVLKTDKNIFFQAEVRIKFQPLIENDVTLLRSGEQVCVRARYQCVTLMKQFEDQSCEELRREFYSSQKCDAKTSRVVLTNDAQVSSLNDKVDESKIRSFPQKLLEGSKKNPVFGAPGALRSILPNTLTSCSSRSSCPVVDSSCLTFGTLGSSAIPNGFSLSDNSPPTDSFVESSGIETSTPGLATVANTPHSFAAGYFTAAISSAVTNTPFQGSNEKLLTNNTLAEAAAVKDVSDITAAVPDLAGNIMTAKVSTVNSAQQDAAAKSFAFQDCVGSFSAHHAPVQKNAAVNSLPNTAKAAAISHSYKFPGASERTSSPAVVGSNAESSTFKFSHYVALASDSPVAENTTVSSSAVKDFPVTCSTVKVSTPVQIPTITFAGFNNNFAKAKSQAELTSHGNFSVDPNLAVKNLEAKTTSEMPSDAAATALPAGRSPGPISLRVQPAPVNSCPVKSTTIRRVIVDPTAACQETAVETMTATVNLPNPDLGTKFQKMAESKNNLTFNHEDVR